MPASYASMPVLTRTKRGRDANTRCRARCTDNETLSHVLQKCHRTHRTRIRRHDNLVRYVADVLKKKDRDVVVEPRLKTSLGSVHVPDLVITKGEVSAIIDAQVVGTGIDVDLCHESKVLDYSTEEICRLVQGHRKEATMVTSLTMNYRGVWSPRSAKDLLDLGLTMQDLKILTVRCLQGGMLCYRVFGSITTVTGFRRGA